MFKTSKPSANFNAATTGSKTKDETLDIYKTWALSYDDDMNAVGWKTPGVIAEIVKERATPGSKVIDFAAGTGVVGKLLAGSGFSVDALDACAEMLAVAESNGVYDNYFLSFIGGGHALPFEKESYDVAVMSGGFVEGHVPMDAWDALVEAVKPGGLIVASITEIYMTVVPAYRGMNDYVRQLCADESDSSGKAENGADDDDNDRKRPRLVERRECPGLVGEENVVVWIIRK